MIYLCVLLLQIVLQKCFCVVCPMWFHEYAAVQQLQTRPSPELQCDWVVKIQRVISAQVFAQ